MCTFVRFYKDACESWKRFSPIRAQRLCHGQYKNFMNYWELSLFAPASITHKWTAWWNDLIAHWKQWFESSFTKTPKIWTDGWNPFCSLCERSRKPPQDFPFFELLYGRQPHGVLDVLRETWEEGPSESKNEIQHVLDLRTKLHTLRQLSMENLLQAQDKQSRLYNRGTRLRNFAPGDKVLVLLPTSSSKLLAKWQGPFEVTRRIRDLNYEVIRTDRSGACQIYHLNLLKKWSEVEPVMLATAISGEDDLGSEVNTKIQSLTLAPGGDHLLPSQLTDVARLQTEFADVFSPLPGRTNLIQHHIEMEPGVVVRSRPYRLPEHKKKVVQSELEAMLEMGVIEESHSDWASARSFWYLKQTARFGSVWIIARWMRCWN